MIEELINDLGIANYLIIVILAMVVFSPFLLHLFLKRFKIYWTFWNAYFIDNFWVQIGLVGLGFVTIIVLLSNPLAGLVFAGITYIYYSSFKGDMFSNDELNAMWNDNISNENFKKRNKIIDVLLIIYLIVFLPLLLS